MINIKIKKATENEIAEVIDLHNILHPGESFSGALLSFVIANGKTYIATIDDKIIGYVSINNLLKGQLTNSLNKFISSIDNINFNTESMDSEKNPFFIISLFGMIPEYNQFLSKLIEKAIGNCIKKDYFNYKYLTVFIRKNDIQTQNIYLSKGFSLTNYKELNMFNSSNEKEDGVLMFKKINFINKILTKY